MAKFKQGDKVSWNTPQGKVDGAVVKKLTNDIKVKGHHVKASPDVPQYEVKSDSSGNHAAHKPDSLEKR